MVTLVSIKLRGESNIIDDNPTMKQADEMSQQFIRDPNNFNVFKPCFIETGLHYSIDSAETLLQPIRIAEKKQRNLVWLFQALSLVDCWEDDGWEVSWDIYDKEGIE